MKIHDLVVQQLDVHSIEQHPENANNGDVDAIVESIQINGYYQPIVVQASTRYVIVGNHRYLAAMKSGSPVVPGFVLKLTDVEAKRMMIADNRLTRMGYDDEAQLLNLLDQLHSTDDGLAGTGYDNDDRQHLFELVHEPLTYEHDESDTPVDNPEGTLGSRLNFGIMPVVSEDGKVYELTLSRAGFAPITANDVNKLRQALGQHPFTPSELGTFGVPAWERASNG